jgi:hypothetical protein
MASISCRMARVKWATKLESRAARRDAEGEEFFTVVIEDRRS